MSAILQERENDAMTVTLPLHLWRRVLFAIESHAEARKFAGYEQVSASYVRARDAIAGQLGVRYSGDQPYSSGE